MTDGQRSRKDPGLHRHITVSGKPSMRPSTMTGTSEAAEDEYTTAYGDAEDDPSSYPPESAYGGIQSSWDSPTTSDQPWLADQQQTDIEDVMNNLSNLDLQRQGTNYPRGGPIFDPNAAGGYPDYAQQLPQRNIIGQAQKIPQGTEAQTSPGLINASTYVPVPGHNSYHSNRESVGSGDGHRRSPSGSDWEPKSRMLKGRGSNPNLGQGYHSQYMGAFGNMPPPPPIPSQYLDQVQSNRLVQGGANMPLGMGGYGPTGGPGQAFGAVGGIMGQVPGQTGLQQQPQILDPAAILSSPIDVPTMIAQKGYNPATFDIRPPFVGPSPHSSKISLNSQCRLDILSSSRIQRMTFTSH